MNLRERVIYGLGAFILTATATAGCRSPEENLPSGYTRRVCNNISASFPAPSEWHIKEEQGGETRACFITKERIISGGVYETGFSVNAIPGISRKRNMSASEFARKFAREVGGQNSNPEERYKPPFRFYQEVATVSVPQLGRSSRVIYAGVGNDEADLAYLITFEAPVSNWSSNEGIGRVMIGGARFNPKFSGTLQSPK